MATRLEGVQISLEIDPSKAIQILNQLEQRTDTLSKKSRALSTTQTAKEKDIITSKSTGTTSVSGGAPVQSVLQKAVNALSSAAPSASPVSGIVSKVPGSIAQKAAAFGIAEKAASSGSVIAEAAAGAAAVYGITRGVAKGGAALTAVAEGAFPELANNPAFKRLSEQFDLLRSAFNYLEAKVGSFFTGIGKTADMQTAMARIHGKIPNLPALFDAFREADRFEGELERRFNDLKSDEVRRAYGLSGRALMKGLHR